jgi:hypothetical protein
MTSIKNVVYSVVATLGVLGGSMEARAADLIASESFDYPAGSSLGGANGGTGWGSPWFLAHGDFGNYAIGSGLTYPGLSTPGGAAQGVSGGESSGAEGRFLAQRQSTGVVWVSVLGDLKGTNRGSDNVRFYDNGSFTGAVGANDNVQTWYLFDNTLDPNSPAAINTGAAMSFSQTVVHLALLKIDYTAQTTTIWMDPNIANFSGTGGQTASFAPTFDSIQMYTRAGGRFDELRIGTTSASVGVPVATPQSRITALESEVGGLLAIGAITSGHVNALSSPLQNARMKLDTGKPKPAANMLNAFINMVQAFAKSEELTDAQAESLIDAARAIIASLPV